MTAISGLTKTQTSAQTTMMEAKQFQMESIGGQSDQLDLHQAQSHVWTQPVMQMFLYYYQRSKRRGLIYPKKL